MVWHLYHPPVAPFFQSPGMWPPAADLTRSYIHPCERRLSMSGRASLPSPAATPSESWGMARGWHMPPCWNAAVDGSAMLECGGPTIYQPASGPHPQHTCTSLPPTPQAILRPSYTPPRPLPQPTPNGIIFLSVFPSLCGSNTPCVIFRSCFHVFCPSFSAGCSAAPTPRPATRPANTLRCPPTQPRCTAWPRATRC